MLASASRYLRAIARIVRDRRWMLFVALLLYIGGLVDGFSAGAALLSGGLLAWTDGGPPYHHALPQLVSQLPAPEWVALFVRNLNVVLVTFAEGAVSLGVLALSAVWKNGSLVGLTVAQTAPLVREASGAGATAVGILLPHGPVEVPALLVAWALAVRTGLVWIRPLPGLRRWASFKRLLREFAMCLPAIAVLLLFAALLETYANPLFVDRFVLGIGQSPGMAQERRVGDHYAATECSWSPDGERMATIDPAGCLWLDRIDGSAAPVLAADPGPDCVFSSPSWSPDGRMIALIREPIDREDIEGYRLMILDVGSGELREVPPGPRGRYLDTAWGPDPNVIACIVLEFSADHTGTEGTNLWQVSVAPGTWQKMTEYPSGRGVATGSGVTWRPDGNALAFIERLPGEDPSHGHDASGTQYALRVMSAHDGDLAEVTRRAQHGDIAWSPDGKWIAFMESGPAGRELCDRIGLVRPDGSERIDDLARADFYSSLSWSPDARRIAYCRLATCIIGEPVMAAAGAHP